MERIVIYLIIVSTCFDIGLTYSSRQIMGRLDYLEERLNAESNKLNAESSRINAESKLRREGFNALFDKVDGIETMLKQILERKEIDTSSSEISENVFSDTPSNKRMNILLKSFKTEKFENKRFKREILQDFNKQAELTQETNERVENCLEYFTQEIGQLKQEALQHDIKSDKIAGQVIQRLEEKTETMLMNLNGTKELVKDQFHLQGILQSQLEDGRYTCLNETYDLTRKLDILLKAVMSESCLDFSNNGFRFDGIYKIQTSPIKTDISVYCDMTTDGGGWIVFQRRRDGSEDFYRDWNDYKYGFGKLDGEFWLGNEYMNLLTDDGKIHELRIDLGDYEGNRAFAKYNKFKIGPESTNYRLEVSGYTGNAGDALAQRHNGMQFSTKDRDNDLAWSNCATQYKGVWWFQQCYSSHLNGQYNKGIVWSEWKGFSHNMKFTEMKLR